MELETIGKILIDFVRITIYDKLNGTKSLNKEELLQELPNFEKKAATFVTLTIDGNLRGCIGTLIPYNTLYDDLRSNALKAAFEDPRFSPLTKEEFEKIKIEISLIGPITPVSYYNFEDLRGKIKPHEHGVILRQGSHQGTFLPQVWDDLPEYDQFMIHLFHKAGLDPAQVKEAPEIFVYTVDKIIEP